MHIAIVVEYLVARGGTQRQALMLARELQRQGHSCTVICSSLDRSACFPDLQEGLNIIGLQEIDQSRANAASNRSSGSARGLVRRLGDASGVNMARTLKYLLRRSRDLALAIRQAHHGAPIDVVNPHDFGAASWAGAKISQSDGIPSVWQCNDPLFRWEKRGYSLRSVGMRAIGTLDRYFGRTHACVTALDHSAAAAIRRQLGVHPTIVRSGVEHERFMHLPAQAAARNAYGLPLDARVILGLTLFTGAHRRSRDFIRVLERLPEQYWLLLCAPYAPGYAECALFCAALNSSAVRRRVVWFDKPMADDEELRRAFAASTCLLFPNEQQTWGLAVIEAMSAGLPVVVSEGAGVHEVLHQSHGGVTYPPGDIATAAKLIERIADDESAVVDYGERAKAFVRSSFSWSKYARDMLTVFQSARVGR